MTVNAATSGCPLVMSDISAHREFLAADGDLVAPDQASALGTAAQPSISEVAAVLRRAQRAWIIR
jgi:hypothetical protein